MNFILLKRDGKIIFQLWSNDGKLIKEEEQKPQVKRIPNPDHKVTLRDDLGLHQMLNNFDKVREKMAKGQKEVYKDGWSIRKL